MTSLNFAGGYQIDSKFGTANANIYCGVRSRSCPGKVLARPKKGFGIPLAKWLKTTPAKPPLTPISGLRMEPVVERWTEHRAVRATIVCFFGAG